MTHWLITGANGNLGKRLIRELLAGDNDRVTAVVRSERAAASIRELQLPQTAVSRLAIDIVDYHDVDALRAVSNGCDKVVHLVGILKETRSASYADAHEASCQALVEALRGSTVQHLTYMSIVGSHPGADNACLASKGRAEWICRGAAQRACVLRVPMVLGEDDYASFALAKRARNPRSFTFRAESLEQPIYAGDVTRAIKAAGDASLDASLDLGGPEILSRKALTLRAAQVIATPEPLVISLPLAFGMAMAWLMQTLLANPPVTTAMLGVLDHDDGIDPQPALEALGMGELTDLDTMLSAVLN